MQKYYQILFSFALGAVSSIGKGQLSERLPLLPMQLPPVRNPTIPVVIKLDDGSRRELTINPELQAHLENFIHDKHMPIAAVVVLDAHSGEVLALVQGKDPRDWGASVHSALYTGFPAASLFKTVVAAAGFEVADLEGEEPIGLTGGCQHVVPNGVWMRTGNEGRGNNYNLRKAYGHSCNGFFAKIAVNYLGLGPIKHYAEKFRFGQRLDTDFQLEPSPYFPPDPTSSSVHTVGRFAAGFGYVGISAVHAAWMSLVLANQGRSKTIRIFKRQPPYSVLEADMSNPPLEVISPATAAKLKAIMDDTVQNGTASFAFRRGKYRKLRNLVGGKTGTLHSKTPRGTTTWFTGMMPLDRPEIIVSAVVILSEDLWYSKGPNLAAEAFWAYDSIKTKKGPVTARIFPE